MDYSSLLATIDNLVETPFFPSIVKKTKKQSSFKLIDDNLQASKSYQANNAKKNSHSRNRNRSGVYFYLKVQILNK